MEYSTEGDRKSIQNLPEPYRDMRSYIYIYIYFYILLVEIAKNYYPTDLFNKLIFFWIYSVVRQHRLIGRLMQSKFYQIH